MSTLCMHYFGILRAMVLGDNGYQFVTKAEEAAYKAAKEKAKAEKKQAPAGKAAGDAAKAEKKQQPVKKPGRLLKNLPLDEAMKMLSQKLEDDGPDRDHLPEALENFRKVKALVGISPENFHPSYENNVKEMQRRFDYSKQCREALLKCLETRVKQYQRWDQIVEGLQGIQPDAGSHRWRERLLRLDDTPESRLHNERIVMLSALLDGKISERAFKDQRYQAYRGAGKSRKEARRLAQEEYESPADCLLEALQNRINETIGKMPQIKTAVTDILNGKAQNLDEAYRVAEDDGIYLMMNVNDALQELQGRLKNFEARKDGIKKQIKEWETIGCTVQATQEFAEDVANPYYSFLDPLEMHKASIGYLNLDQTEDPLGVYMTTFRTNIVKAETFCMGPTLNQYGFEESSNENPENDLMVYHKDGKALIFPLKSTEWKDGQLQFNVDENAPGRLVDKNLRQDMAHYQEEFDKLNIDARPPMAAVGSALTALKDAQLGDNPAEEVYFDFTKKFTDLKKASEACITAHEVSPQQIRLAKDLKSFADTKLQQLADVRSHQSLVMMKEAVKDNIRADGNRTASAMNDVEFDAEFRAATAAPRQYAQSGKRSRSGMANQKIDEYIKSKWESYVTEKAAAEKHKDIDDFAAENDGICKRVLAARVVQSLMANETKMFPSEKDQRVMQEYVINGKLDNLVHMVWNSESFCDQVRCLDLSNRADAEKLMKDGIPKLVAKDITKNFLQTKRQNQPENVPPQNAANNDAPVVRNNRNGPVL